MKIPNLQLPYNLMLDPALAPVLEKLSIDKPNWFYKPVNIKQSRYNPYEHNRSIGGVNAPDGFNYLTKVCVYQDGREAGSISVSTKHSWRTGKSAIEYCVQSERIDNGRRGKSMYSTKLDVTVRNAKKFFDPLKMGEVLYDETESAKYDYSRALSDLGAPIREYKDLRGEMIRVQKYLHAHFNGIPISEERQASVKKLFGSAFEENLSKYELAKRMQKLKHIVLYGADGGFYFWGEDEPPASKAEAATAPIMFLPFDDLPESIQNKVAVLQLMQDKEIVLDTGFRCSDNVFLVVHG